MGTKSRARRCGDECGQAELVIVFPVVMVVILLVLQGALWFLGRSIATDAAQDGARAAAVVGGTPGSGDAAAASDLHQLAGPMLSDTSVAATESAGRAQVTVTGQAESILPGLSLTVSATAAQPIEKFRS